MFILMLLPNEHSINYVRTFDMKFFEAVAKCYRKYFIFKGRASRSEYWWCFLAAFLFAWPLWLAETGEGNWFALLSVAYFLLTLSIAMPLLAAWTRRMHDVGKSGWSWLFIFIPIVGFILLMRWTTKEGSLEANKYGEPDNHPYVQTKATSESK
jgi:uncharacterized membrane protein YhaH (DUF805 family)